MVDRFSSVGRSEGLQGTAASGETQAKARFLAFCALSLDRS
jgi:hypothetical protein